LKEYVNFSNYFSRSQIATKSNKPNTIVIDTHQDSLEISKMKEHVHEKRKPRKRQKQLFTLNPSILNETPFQSVLFDSVEKEEISDQISDQISEKMSGQMSDQSDLSSGPDDLNLVKEEWPQKSNLCLQSGKTLASSTKGQLILEGNFGVFKSPKN
jgi:hypothetical protein